MFRNRFQYRIFVFAFLASVLLSGCTRNINSVSVSSEPPVTSLWIVTEETVSDGMNYQLRTIAEQFQTENAGISIRIDILPTDAEQRQSRLEEIRNQIAVGSGPDIYLLPVDTHLVTESENGFAYHQVEPLFQNVDLAIRNGVFLDIQNNYEQDDALDKDSLQSTVMDAGVVDGGRYVLPLRYNVPIVYAFAEDLVNTGFELTPNQPIDAWIQCLIQLGNPLLACGGEYRSFNAFSNLFDYDTRSIVLDKDDLQQYLDKLIRLESLIGTEQDHRNRQWLFNYVHGAAKQFPVQINQLDSVLTYAAIAKTEHKTLWMEPVHSVDGDVIASVTYYGSIGANCTSPEMAYRFLRTFLLETWQWEVYRGEATRRQYPGLVEQSWPVRTKGSIAPLWLNQQKQASMPGMVVQQEDLPVERIEIDLVRFPLAGPYNFESYWGEIVKASSDEDLSALTDTIFNDWSEMLSQ